MSDYSSSGHDVTIPGDDEQLRTLLERANRLDRSLRCEADDDNQLADMVESLSERVETVTSKHALGGARIEQYMAADTSRLENVKQRHEELSEEFNEFCNWHLVEPRSLFWRTLDKVGFYLTVILSFIFVVPFTAIYSKTLRFIRNRRRLRSPAYERPAWTTGQGEVEPDFVPSDFFGEGGLARLAVNQLRLSKSSNDIGVSDSGTDGTAEQDVFSGPAVDVKSKSSSSTMTPSQGIEPRTVEGDSNSGLIQDEEKRTNGLRRRRWSKRDLIRAEQEEEQRSSAASESSSPATQVVEGDDQPEDVGTQIDTEIDREEEVADKDKAGWVIDEGQEWGMKESEDSSDFWAVFGRRKSSKS